MTGAKVLRTNGLFYPNLRKFSLFIDLKMKSGARKSTWSKEVQSVIQALGGLNGRRKKVILVVKSENSGGKIFWW